jgi:hypothetical protein
MAFQHVNSKGETYFLHQYDAKLKGGRVYRNYFFAKSISPKGTPIDSLPAGRDQIVENPKTGLPVLKSS